MAILRKTEVAQRVNQVTSRTAGVAVGLNSNRECNSPSRLYMLSKNQGKAAVIDFPTNRKLPSGDEQEYAKTARRIETLSEVQVMEIFFIRDPYNTAETTPWGTTYVIVKDLENGQYDVIEMSKFNAQNMDLGFEYAYKDDLMRTLKKGARYRKGTTFATSTRISESNEWCPGLETRVAAMSHVYTEEDAVVISESYAKKVGVTFCRTHDHQWNEEEYIPLNLYGTANDPQPFPLPGQSVRADGIVMGFRRKDPAVALSALSAKALMTPDPIYDLLYFSPNECVVADIEVQTERYKNQSNNRRAEKISQPHTRVFEQYEEAANTMYNEVLRWYNRLTFDYSDKRPPLSKPLWNFIVQCKAHITRDYSTPHANGKFHKIKRKISNINLKDWRVVIKLKQRVEGKVRFKNTGMDGNKSVIMKVLPDYMMPVDDHGVRAEMIGGNTPAFRRQILGSLIEQDVNFVNIHIWPTIIAAKNAGDYEKAYQIAHRFYDTVNPNFAAMVNRLSDEGKRNHVDWITSDENEFCVKGASGTDIVGIKITDRIIENYPDIQPTPVTYINEFGTTVRTRYPVKISSLYYIMLDKFGDDISSQSFPRLNIFGLPTSLSKHERARDFYRATLNRNVGETEGRLFVNQRGGAAAVRALALANGPELMAKAVKRIIRADNPFTIEQLVLPGEEKGNHSLQVIENIMADFGIGLRNENENDLVA